MERFELELLAGNIMEFRFLYSGRIHGRKPMRIVDRSHYSFMTSWHS